MTSLKSRIEGISSLLSDIEDKETRISSLLFQFGFPDAQVEEARRDHMSAIAALLVESIRKHVKAGPDGCRLYEVLERRYGLKGDGRVTLESVGNSMGITRERVRQLQVKAVRRCKRRSRAGYWPDAFHDAVRDYFWEHSATNIAQSLLQTDPPLTLP